ncbi:MAG: helix-turn-helix domain-containing protein [Dongiaceae bacterium]
MIQHSTTPTDEVRPDLGIDLGTFQCGKSMLTRREHQILGLLNRHFGLLVTWQRIGDMLYWNDADGGPDNPKNVMSVAIHGLRRKMLDTGYQIVTVPNEGLILRYRDYVGRALRTGT